MDYLVLTSAVIQALVMLFGATTALATDWAKEHRRFSLAVFALLGLSGIAVTVSHSSQTTRETAAARVEAVEANAELASNVDQLSTASDEIARVQALNTDLQRQVLSSAQTIQELAARSIDELTGGESFPYLSFGRRSSQGNLDVGLLSKGQHPSLNVQIRVVDVDGLQELIRTGRRTMEAMKTVERVLTLPYISAEGVYRPLYGFRVGSGESARNFNVFIHARNGSFTQLVRLRRIGDDWLSATRVIAKYASGRHGLVLDEYDSGFPKDLLADDEWETDEPPIQITDCLVCPPWPH